MSTIKRITSKHEYNEAIKHPGVVLIFLYSQTNTQSGQKSNTKCLEAENELRKLAQQGNVKVLKMVGSECIANYPDRNLPTVLVYSDGDLKSTLYRDECMQVANTVASLTQTKSN